MMRFKTNHNAKTDYPNIGDKRKRKAFLLFPKTMSGECRWLEWVEWEEVYTDEYIDWPIPVCYPALFPKWTGHRWL